MTTPTSYLQTLSKDDAIAFVTSLQKVKDYLQSEVAWMSEQVQQKTIQLQGIETLLSEAVTLGLPGADAPSELTQTPEEDTASTDLEDETHSTTPNSLDNLDTIAASNGSAAPDEDTLSHTSKTSSSTRKRKVAPKAQPQAKSTATQKTSIAGAKGGKSSPKSTGKPKSSGRRADLRELLLPQFAGKSITDAVAQVLTKQGKELHLNQLLTELYGTLSHQDFGRAKVSLANVLSVGKKEGKWQNNGNGLYRANAGAAI